MTRMVIVLVNHGLRDMQLRMTHEAWQQIHVA